MTVLDRLKASLDAVVQLMQRRVDYFALYPAKVLANNSDGTLELQPDDVRLPGLSRVPMRLGLPGVTVKVAPGSRVLLGFEAGSPSRPVATIWESSGLLEVTISAAAKVQLGGAGPAQSPLLENFETCIKAWVTAAVPSLMVGGPTTAADTAMAAAAALNPYKSAVVKVK